MMTTGALLLQKLDYGELNKEAIRHWVKALRSGKYTQIQGMLHDRHGYCCLGVLCDIARKPLGGRWQGAEDHDLSYTFATNASASSIVLPGQVREWVFGKTNVKRFVLENPAVRTRNNKVAPLTKLNDNGIPFDRIADYIEDTYLKEEGTKQ